MDWYLEVLRKYVDFSGRARRKEYWIYGLFNLLAFLILGGIGALIDAAAGTSKDGIWLDSLVGIYYLATLLPSLAVTVRRFHDTGKSGWWILLAFVPLGSIVLLIFECLDSDPGTNQYGPSPKAVPHELPAT